MINKTIAMLDVVGIKALDFARTIPKAAYVAFMVVAMVLMGQQSAQADTHEPNDPMAFIGCPTLAWAAPLQDTSQNVTGMFFGFVIIAGLLVMFLAGVGLLFARNNQMKANGAIETAKNVGSGFLVVLVGVPVVALIVWGLATVFNPACG